MVGIISLASSLVTYVLILSGCGGVWPAVGHVYVKSFHSLPSRGGEGGECDIHCAGRLGDTFLSTIMIGGYTDSST